VAFTRGTHAQDQPLAARGDIRLIGVRHERGVEKRGGLEGVLKREIGADQQFPDGRSAAGPLINCCALLKRAETRELFLMALALNDRSWIDLVAPDPL